ncbi:hypothetical protein BDV97DRAFT_394928 [Delphinella strobiligena]|nr:hypothetical protein BDV97DRAFT_394928 [Delphinella strobiligena]
MAEGLAVAGFVVGIASIAIQLVDTTQQLRSFVGDVKHAPQDVAEMLEHVDTFGEMIQDIAAEEQEHLNIFVKNKYLKRCLTQYEREIQAISVLLEHLAESVRRSKLKGSLRTVFRTRDVQKLASKLEKAQELLTFAFQIYAK